MITLEAPYGHLSIPQLPKTDVSDFTVLTGINGSGKSHLLRGIVQKAVKCYNDSGNLIENVKHFDINSFFPVDEGSDSSEHTPDAAKSSYALYNRLKTIGEWKFPLTRVVKDFGLPHEYIADPTKVAPNSDIIKKLTEGRHSEFCIKFDEALQEAKQEFEVYARGEFNFNISSVCKFAKKDIFDLSKADFYSPHALVNLQDMFKQSLTTIFLAYRNAYLRNNMEIARRQHDETAEPLSMEEFREKFGAPPWNFVNAAIQSAGLNFEIDHPDMDDFTSYSPTLRKSSSGLHVPFSALSSGEKIIMSLVLCIYNGTSDLLRSNRPELVLFDEIDSPLHPQMSKALINTLYEVMTKNMGIKVILVTHSPSTIALSPDNSIYVIDYLTKEISHTGKAKALNSILVGVPALSISFEGRRQVFVESARDAKVYESLYRTLRSSLYAERSLDFIATGSTKNGQAIGGGCSNVIKMVETLTNFGNQSIFGLIDWDQEHSKSGRVHVFAEGRRDGIENVLFDPLLIALAIWEYFPVLRSGIRNHEHVSLNEIKNFDAKQMQALADSITFRIFKSMPDQRIVSQYEGGLSIDIDERVFITDDHVYQSMIYDAFPPFANIHKSVFGESLHENIACFVLPDYIQFIPIEFRQIFESLLLYDLH